MSFSGAVVEDLRHEVVLQQSVLANLAANDLPPVLQLQLELGGVGEHLPDPEAEVSPGPALLAPGEERVREAPPGGVFLEQLDSQNSHLYIFSDLALTSGFRFKVGKACSFKVLIFLLLPNLSIFFQSGIKSSDSK